MNRLLLKLEQSKLESFNGFLRDLVFLIEHAIELAKELAPRDLAPWDEEVNVSPPSVPYEQVDSLYLCVLNLLKLFTPLSDSLDFIESRANMRDGEVVLKL